MEVFFGTFVEALQCAPLLFFNSLLRALRLVLTRKVELRPLRGIQCGRASHVGDRYRACVHTCMDPWVQQWTGTCQDKCMDDSSAFPPHPHMSKARTKLQSGAEVARTVSEYRLALLPASSVGVQQIAAALGPPAQRFRSVAAGSNLVCCCFML